MTDSITGTTETLTGTTETLMGTTATLTGTTETLTGTTPTEALTLPTLLAQHIRSTEIIGIPKIVEIKRDYGMTVVFHLNTEFGLFIMKLYNHQLYLDPNIGAHLPGECLIDNLKYHEYLRVLSQCKKVKVVLGVFDVHFANETETRVIGVYPADE